MSDLNHSGDASSASAANHPPAANGPKAKDEQDCAQLQQRVADLLQEVQELRLARQPALEDLVRQLREANQHLVIATLGAQDQLSNAELAKQRQEQFLAMLAHELRNPLAPIALATQLLGKLVESHPQLPRLHGIFHRQASHLTHLVDDLLDASRISSGKIALQKCPLLLTDIIDSALETSMPSIERRFQHFEMNLPHEPIWLDGDSHRLAQVFANLLINASKFSPEYEYIKLLAYRQADAIAISVQDHGIGIAPAMQSRIFELFTQGFTTAEHSQGGLGIGLSLVRSIVELHHGSVSVNSAGLGLGSIFTVCLPICAAPHAIVNTPIDVPEKATEPKKQLKQAFKILLIEDNHDTNDTLGELLQQEGHIIACAGDGQSGLDLAQHQAFDVVVCDIGLPDISGFAVAKQLRMREHPACLIALTGYNQLQARALQAGFDHYLMKPVTTEKLLRLILSCRPHVEK
ncbi:MAG: response regulator [Burkholderiales bacterium]|nr:response regulator [Burkholderiales bacterium]